MRSVNDSSQWCGRLTVQDVASLEESTQAKVEAPLPDPLGWEGLQPPLWYTQYLHIAGNYKDDNVIVE